MVPGVEPSLRLVGKVVLVAELATGKTEFLLKWKDVSAHCSALILPSLPLFCPEKAAVS
jgi:hypothetical protein